MAFILRNLGLEKSDDYFFALNYADDYPGAEATKTKAELSFITLGELLCQICLTEAVAKANQPTQQLTYLGAGFDTNIYVDAEKLVELKYVLSKWVRKSVAKKADL